MYSSVWGRTNVEMSPWVRVLAAKSDDMNLTPRTHRWKERRFPKAILYLYKYAMTCVLPTTIFLKIKTKMM